MQYNNGGHIIVNSELFPLELYYCVYQRKRNVKKTYNSDRFASYGLASFVFYQFTQRTILHFNGCRRWLQAFGINLRHTRWL